MPAVNDGVVEIVQHGQRVRVLYRVAVGRIARGRATWATTTVLPPTEVGGAGEGAVLPSTPAPTPTPDADPVVEAIEPPVPTPEPASPSLGATKRTQAPPKPVKAAEPVISKPTVSTPTKRAEGVLTEHEPSPFDP